ncbi:MAG: SDR family oxidoreductase [Candidatus Peribacteraceae bacterium]|jgi:NADP-dependent 3-hydroxy acid dehydrogenase YdfG|nr:SDR family oxidoreductase [Candidatus Peribacteraceae bacterium]HCI04050.1 hypothetical protein [Candidatus Peribacteria bacterium]|tara:strand:+ start:1234 stop:1932 length:699 start_codon:yes stop_codon:yes gene_type:complete
MQFENAQSLVTGASSGMGLAFAKRLAAQGSTIHSFDVQEPLESVDGLIHHPVNLCSEAELTKAMDAVPDKLNILFNNAGVLVRGGLFETDVEQFRTMLGVNVIGSWLTLKTALEQSKLADDATVIQMCSTVGLNPAPKLRTYSLTKQLLHAMIQALRDDYPDLNVKGVYPGAVKTPMTMKGFRSEDEYDKQAIANWGVVSTAEELADKIMELIDSESNDLVWNSTNREYQFE